MSEVDEKPLCRALIRVGNKIISYIKDIESGAEILSHDNCLALKCEIDKYVSMSTKVFNKIDADRPNDVDSLITEARLVVAQVKVYMLTILKNIYEIELKRIKGDMEGYQLYDCSKIN